MKKVRFISFEEVIILILFCVISNAIYVSTAETQKKDNIKLSYHIITPYIEFLRIFFSLLYYNYNQH